ncbi:MAG: hypothetical protein RHS_0689 [Robinsoniella sp. RHS]|nr:MAG: hypothetical protein RHS_0689 [Robinsoniella sp. RHS]
MYFINFHSASEETYIYFYNSHYNIKEYTFQFVKKIQKIVLNRKKVIDENNKM